MQIHALISYYNDYATLGMAINSIEDQVDSIIACDGAYELYYKTIKQSNPAVQPWSTDGSTQILQASPTAKKKLKIIPPPNRKPWLNQCTKRTALLNAVPQGDWFVVLDSDEMLYGDVELGLNEIMRSGCLAGTMPLYNPGLDVGSMYPTWHPRIFLKLDGMHYSRKHWNLRDAEHRVIENSYPVKWTDSMVLTHLKVFRDRGRLASHHGYMHMMSLEGWMEPVKITGQVRNPAQFNIDQ